MTSYNEENQVNIFKQSALSYILYGETTNFDESITYNYFADDDLKPCGAATLNTVDYITEGYGPREYVQNFDVVSTQDDSSIEIGTIVLKDSADESSAFPQVGD